MALVLPGLRVEDDDAVVEVAVGDVELVGLLVDEEPRRASNVVGVVAAAIPARVADLQQELSLAGELQEVVVFLRAAAQPDVVVAVDEDAVRRAEPLVAVPGAPHACRNFPLESNSSTAGAGMQHSAWGGLSAAAFSPSGMVSGR